jgi:integrase
MKTYSDPVRRLDSRGAATTTITFKGKKVRRRCYEGWFCRWYDRETKRQGWEYGGSTIERARARKRELEDAAAAGESHIEGITFKDATTKYVAWRQGKKGDRSRWTRTELPRLAKALCAAPQFQGKLLSEVQRRDVEDYLTKRVAVSRKKEESDDKKPRAVSPRTKNIDLKVLQALMRWGHANGYMRRVHAEKILAIEPEDTYEREPRIITREEEQALLAACHDEYHVKGITGPRNVSSTTGGKSADTKSTWQQPFTPPAWLHPLVLLGLRTGLRLSTIAGLERRHVNLEKGTLTIPGAETKNRRDLVVPLNEDAKRTLRDLLAKAPVQGPQTQVFAGVGVPTRPQVSRSFKAAAKRAKIAPTPHFHDLRKTAATRLLEAGVDVKTVMMLGSWKDPGTLLKVYAAPTADAKRIAIEKLSG